MIKNIISFLFFLLIVLFFYFVIYQYLSENRPPEYFWDDAITKLKLTIITNAKEVS